MSKAYEAGIRPNRLEHVRETTEGVFVSNPAWNLFSDNARTLEPTIDPQTEGQRGLGSPDPIDHNAATEVSQLVVAYDLQEKSGSGETFLDGSSNPNDAVTDALQRAADNTLQNTHTVVRRMVQNGLDAGNTVNGSTSYDTRQYFVGVGGKIDQATITGDPNDPQPVLVELTYEFEKGRLYQVDQPDSGTQLDVVSSDPGDTTQTLTIEDEGASTTEDVALNGTTTQTTTASFDNLDALELDAETAGDVTVSISGGDSLAILRGSDAYGRGEGDLGIPALGTGSHASAIGQAYELVQDTTIERPSGTSVGDIVNSTEISVGNNVGGDAMPQLGTPRRALSAGDREAQADVTVAGETEAVNHTDEMLRVTATNLLWTFTGGSIQLDSAAIIEVAEDTEEASQSKKAIDLTLEGQGVTVS